MSPITSKVYDSYHAAWYTHGGPDVLGVADPTTSHGFYVSATNTGHDAYFDATLGRLVTDSDLTVHSTVMSASDFVSAGGTISKQAFDGGLIIDIDNVTFNACRGWRFSGYWSGVHHPFELNYVTVESTSSDGGDGVLYQDYYANWCRIGGSTDGAKINGNAHLADCYVRTLAQAAGDHNDGLQAVGSYTGGSIQRCNIDVTPVNGIGGPNCCIFIADSSNGTWIIEDNYLQHGQFLMGLHENCNYVVDGNWGLADSWITGPQNLDLAASVSWGTTKQNLYVDASGTMTGVWS